ncbi:AraC family transcriptional regulator [Halovulum sp. GXIMD14794]
MTTIRGWGPLPALVRDMAGERALSAILKRHDLPASVMGMPHRRVPLAKMVRVFAAAADVLGDERFGATVGDRTQPESYGSWSVYAYCAPTLGEGLQRVCRTIWAHETGSSMLLSERRAHVVWCYSTGLADHENVRQFTDHLFGSMIAFIRSFLGADWQPAWIELDYPRPPGPDRPHEPLDVPVFHDMPCAGIAIPKAALSAEHIPGTALPRPLTMVDLLKLRPRGHVDPLEHYLEAVDLCLVDGRTDIDSTAGLLDQGPRTLQRRLRKHGVGFRDLLRIARRRRAAALLVETDQPVKAIAAQLGYGSPENFTRAFRDWFDVSPSEFKRAQRQQYRAAPPA